MLNRIVTNGFGRSRGAGGVAGPATLGFGGVARQSQIDTGVPRRARGNGTKEQHTSKQDAIVWARLLLVNGIAPVKQVKGFVRVPFVEKGPVRAIVEHLDTKKKQDVRIAIERIRTKRQP